MTVRFILQIFRHAILSKRAKTRIFHDMRGIKKHRHRFVTNRPNKQSTHAHNAHPTRAGFGLFRGVNLPPDQTPQELPSQPTVILPAATMTGTLRTPLEYFSMVSSFPVDE